MIFGCFVLTLSAIFSFRCKSILHNFIKVDLIQEDENHFSNYNIVVLTLPKNKTKTWQSISQFGFRLLEQTDTSWFRGKSRFHHWDDDDDDNNNGRRQQQGTTAMIIDDDDYDHLAYVCKEQ